jgi:hypothetical protein
MQCPEQESIGVFINLIYLLGNQLVVKETLLEPLGLNSIDEQSCYTDSVAGSRGITAVK